MVAKHAFRICDMRRGLNLAKIHMVAKPFWLVVEVQPSLNLAKIHMVAKLPCSPFFATDWS